METSLRFQKKRKDFVCCGWFLLHSTRYAKDFALRNKVIILSGALTSFPPPRPGQAMTTTKKDKKAKDNKDQRRRDRGRSRERRDSQHRDRRRIREADRTTTRRRRSRSRSNRKPVLVAAPTAEAAPPAIAPAAAEVEVEDEDNEEDDEESEEEEPREDDEAEANVVPLRAPSVPPPAAKAAEEDAPVSGAAGPDEGQGKDLDFKSKGKTEGGRAETPRLAPSRSQRPPEPVKGPRTKPVVVISPEKDDKTGEDPKHSQYQCQVCQRKVGGGRERVFPTPAIALPPSMLGVEQFHGPELFLEEMSPGWKTLEQSPLAEGHYGP